MKNLMSMSKRMVKTYSFGLLMGAFSLSLLALGSTNAYSFPVQAVNMSDAHTLHLATGLEDTLWTAVVKHDSRKLNKLISEEFLGISFEGVSTQADILASFSNSNLPSYTLLDIVATRKHDTLVITYVFTNPDPMTSGLVNGINVSVWKKSEHHWKLFSQSFFPLLT